MTTNQNDTEMTDLNVEIPLKLHRDVKVAAIEDDISLKDWVAAALQYRLDERKKEKEPGKQKSSNSAGEASIIRDVASEQKPSSSRRRSSHGGRASKRS
jgi:hypothetical protein